MTFFKNFKTLNLISTFFKLFSIFLQLFQSFSSYFRPLSNHFRPFTAVFDLFHAIFHLFHAIFDLFHAIFDLFHAIFDLFKAIFDLFQRSPSVYHVRVEVTLSGGTLWRKNISIENHINIQTFFVFGTKNSSRPYAIKRNAQHWLTLLPKSNICE